MIMCMKLMTDNIFIRFINRPDFSVVHAVAQWLKHSATNLKIACWGSDEVTEFYQCT
jgi:hypothetical protein